MAENFNNDAWREYTNAEYLQMYRQYVRQGDDSRRAAEDYALSFPNRRHPDHRVIQNVVDSLSDTGCVNPRARERQPVPSITPTELVNLILAAFSDDDRLSTRICALRLGTNHTLVHKILVKNGWYPYHYRKVQGFRTVNDYVNRLHFCNIFVAGIIMNPALPIYILYSDECTFTYGYQPFLTNILCTKV